MRKTIKRRYLKGIIFRGLRNRVEPQWRGDSILEVRLTSKDYIICTICLVRYWKNIQLKRNNNRNGGEEKL